jgi:hypothetical protein
VHKRDSTLRDIDLETSKLKNEIMKKIMAFTASLFMTANMVFAAALNNFDNDRPIEFSELPEGARKFVNKHFSGTNVTHVTVDKDFDSTEYKVFLEGGVKLEFNGSGEWREVENRYAMVPRDIVPSEIASYVASNYPSSTIVEIKRGRNGWELTLSGGLELSFNKKYELVEIDD